MVERAVVRVRVKARVKMAVAVVLSLCGWCAPARAQSSSAALDVYADYAGCLDRLAAQRVFAPLSVAGFFSDAAADGDGGSYASAAQAALVARFQGQDALCQVTLRTALENVDAKLADAAAQERQSADANELMLMDGLEDWRAYRGNRRRIEGDFWRAAVLGGGGAGGLITGLEADDGAAALN